MTAVSGRLERTIDQTADLEVFARVSVRQPASSQTAIQVEPPTQNGFLGKINVSLHGGNGAILKCGVGVCDLESGPCETPFSFECCRFQLAVANLMTCDTKLDRGKFSFTWTDLSLTIENACQAEPGLLRQIQPHLHRRGFPHELFREIDSEILRQLRLKPRR